MRLPKVFWIFILVISIAYFGYSVYMFFWRWLYCLNLGAESSKIPLMGADDYLVYKITYRKVCGGGPGILPIIVSCVAMWYGFKGWVLSGVRSNKWEK
ncbi:MAG: hypothetical protein A2816_00425 [Candidatus Yanofskybacteria bacterium RIFCSPHIGHO2_01_FULL_39_44]|nr:MAG: hypothetical protein A2816_00425 [Candidatus Yanofskybacteria bacterium RIFCSPHIGHO2_01_FULL_39_44]